MDITELLHFEKHKATNQYCTVVNDLGQVCYCETDEPRQLAGEWKLVNLDIQAMSVLH